MQRSSGKRGKGGAEIARSEHTEKIVSDDC